VLSLFVLADFAEFTVYDSRVRDRSASSGTPPARVGVLGSLGYARGILSDEPPCLSCAASPPGGIAPRPRRRRSGDVAIHGLDDTYGRTAV
jgi:hypothetical protein